MAIRKINLAYYVYFRDENGVRRTRALKTRDPVVAAEREKLFMAEINRRRFAKAFGSFFPDANTPVSVAPQPAAPIEGEHQRGGIAIKDMWECALQKRALSQSHFSLWRRFEAEIGVKYADQVTPKLALDYLEQRYNDGNGKTYNNAKSVLNTIFRCCLVEAGLSASPFAAIINRRVTDIEHHRNLTADEFDRAFDTAPLHLRIMMMLSRWTCQRLETCARMTPAMFDFERLVFLIDPGKNRRFKEWVCCPIMPPLAEFIKPILAQCPDPEKPILANFYQIKKRANAYISHDFANILRKIGISKTNACFHSIRGTAITWFKEHGVTGDVLRAITGHDSDAVEDIYARPVEIVSAVAKKAAKNGLPVA